MSLIFYKHDAPTEQNFLIGIRTIKMVDVSSAFDVPTERGGLPVAGSSPAHISDLSHGTED